LFVGEDWTATDVDASSEWLCAAICCTVSVISSAPPVSARMKPLP